ncbi:MAG: BLUF domain-containing protein [Burkholderiales bacterium]
MAHSENPFQLLYVSRLARDCTWEVVKEIVATARLHNTAHDITGALLFDGERFCQLIEGSEANVRALAHNIYKDVRHSSLRTLFTGPSAIGRTTQRWVSGYCEAHELETFDAESGPREVKALDAFLAVLQGADME